MQITRRAVLAASAGLTALLSGCTSGDTDTQDVTNTTMTSQLDIGQSAQALYQNMQEKARLGYSVDSGCGVTIDSGNLGDPDTLSIGSGDVYFDGSTVSVSSQSVKIDDSDSSYPRKDVVYVDGDGSAQVAKGTPAEPPQSQKDLGARRFEFYQPSPPALDATDAVVLAEVWVPAGASSLSSSDVADRRVSTTVVSSLETDVDAKGNSISNLESVSTEQEFTGSRLADAVVHQLSDGDWVADGEDGQISRDASASTVVQAALDASGVQHIEAHGLDPEGVYTNIDFANDDQKVVYLFDGTEYHQNDFHNGIKFLPSTKSDGSPKDGAYNDISWYADARGADDLADADVVMTAHRSQTDGTVQKHHSLYTSNAALDSLVKRRDIRYAQDDADVLWNRLGLWRLRMNEYRLQSADGSQQHANFFKTSGGFRFVFNPRTDSGSENVAMDVFRGTNTTGIREFTVHKGDGTNTNVFSVRADSDVVNLAGSELRGDGDNSRVQLNDFTNLPPRSSAPSSPSSGDVACQDGTNWDPAGTGNEEIVAYVNGAWTAMT